MAVVISCGAAKVETLQPVQAWRLYTGGYFKTMLDLATRASADVKILSAEYGLLELNDLILPYDLKMTAARARYFRELQAVKYSGMSLLGQTYCKAVTGEIQHLIPPDTGRMGKRLQYAKQLIDRLPRVLINPETLQDGQLRHPIR